MMYISSNIFPTTIEFHVDLDYSLGQIRLSEKNSMATQGQVVYYLKWEKSDFPILCETCLGPNPYVRMLKDTYGRECKVCGRPYTVFKWAPGVGERWKKTEICQTCAKIKNSCQTCLLDLEYGIHTKERDEVLGTHNSIPMSDVNSQVYVRKMEAQMGGAAVVNHGKAESAAKEVLKKIAKASADPYTQRNKGSICAFYVRGNCKRDKDCPFLHQMPVSKKSTATNGGAVKTMTDSLEGGTKTVELQDALAIPVPAPVGKDKSKNYPSQNPNLLGTSTRTFSSS